MRQNMSDVKDSEQIQWVSPWSPLGEVRLTPRLSQRIEEIGYDKDERYYFVLDDNRLYRRTDPPPPLPPAPKPKANSKKGKAAARASKRRKTQKQQEEAASEADGETPAVEADYTPPEEADDGFGGRKWECIAVTLTEYQGFLESIRKSRNSDEKALHQRITEEVLPVIEKAEESLLRKKQKKEREMMNIEKLATAKRSSRLEAKMERERQEKEAAEAERKKKTDLMAAKKDQEKQKNMEEARESRMMTREQRIKDREYKRILHEEELANLSEENKKAEAGEARLSERHLKTEMEKKKKELAALDEDDEWFFDCSKCGVHGTNLVGTAPEKVKSEKSTDIIQDDGTHSVACEKCNVWQHSACLGISQAEAEKDDFQFICHDCKRREEDAKKPKIPSLKFHIGSSSSPPSQKTKAVAAPGANEGRKRKSNDGDVHMPPLKKYKPVNSKPQASDSGRSGLQNGNASQNGLHTPYMNGSTSVPPGQVRVPIDLYAGNQERNPYSTSSIQSPQKPAAYVNGYASPNNNNSYVPQLPMQAFQTPHTSNGSNANGHQAQNVGWSARYTPPQQPQHQQSHNPLPPALNPFANSFDRQRPISSHSNANVPSPLKQIPPLSPPQYNGPVMSPPPFQTPQTNGVLNHQPLPPTGPPAYSPVKQPSPKTTHAIGHQPSSSPVTRQPPLHANRPPSPGFSPTKHSPPRQPPPGHGTPAVLPPAPQLSPSPRQ